MSTELGLLPNTYLKLGTFTQEKSFCIREEMADRVVYLIAPERSC